MGIVCDVRLEHSKNAFVARPLTNVIGSVYRLVMAQKSLLERHPSLTLSIFDAYRPLEVQNYMVEHSFQELSGGIASEQVRPPKYNLSKPSHGLQCGSERRQKICRAESNDFSIEWQQSSY